jgi:hypothetical protein
MACVDDFVALREQQDGLTAVKYKQRDRSIMVKKRTGQIDNGNINSGIS